MNVCVVVKSADEKKHEQWRGSRPSSIIKEIGKLPWGGFLESC